MVTTNCALPLAGEHQSFAGKQEVSYALWGEESFNLCGDFYCPKPISELL